MGKEVNMAKQLKIERSIRLYRQWFIVRLNSNQLIKRDRNENGKFVSVLESYCVQWVLRGKDGWRFSLVVSVLKLLCDFWRIFFILEDFLAFRFCCWFVVLFYDQYHRNFREQSRVSVIFSICQTYFTYFLFYFSAPIFLRIFLKLGYNNQSFPSLAW